MFTSTCRTLCSKDYLPAYLHAVAFLITLNIQFTWSPIIVAWVPFHFAACGIMLADGGGVKERHIFRISVLWLSYIAFVVFILAPFNGAAIYGWNLAILPMIAICMRERYLKPYIRVFFSVLLLFAILIISLGFMGVTYSNYNYPGIIGSIPSWPIIDPNNTALILVVGLLATFYVGMDKPKWWFFTAVFSLALLLTMSRAGFLAAAVGVIIMVHSRNENLAFIILVTLLISILCYLEHYGISIRGSRSLETRLDIWKASWELLKQFPFGIGLGMFPVYYAKVRTEQYTGGYFAHNDLLQFGIEMGWVAPVIFTALVLCVCFSITYRNKVSGCILLAILLQSLVEFQLYLPFISLLSGIALAHFRINSYEK